MGAYSAAKEKATHLTEEGKDAIMDIILKELTIVVSNRIRFTEEVMDRVLPIATTYTLEDGRVLNITLK